MLRILSNQKGLTKQGLPIATSKSQGLDFTFLLQLGLVVPKEVLSGGH